MDVDARFELSFVHRLRFTRDAFEPRNRTLADVLDPGSRDRSRVLVFVDTGLADARADLRPRIEAYFDAHRQRNEPANGVQLVPGGEPVKNDPATLEAVLRAIHDARLCRQSYVVAVGGGAVLDLVGYAAAIAHRGVRLVRLPTTTLSQADSGVAVKNGVNAFGRKNYLGTFSPPWAVINDTDLLETLSDRDWHSGFSEAVKIGLVKDRGLFTRIAADAARIQRRDASAALPVLRRSVELHLQHIVTCGDAFELTHARPLDFGHWAAHKLEQLTDFRLRHGEAVAIGVALDSIYSALAGHLPWREAETICGCLRALGLALCHQALLRSELLDGLEEFREHLGGPLTITLLRRIGEGFDVHAIDRPTMLEAIQRLSTIAAPTPYPLHVLNRLS